MLNVIDKLHRDHEQVEELFRKLMQTGDGAEKARADLCRKLVTELKAHTQFEEQVFYPAIRQYGDDAGEEVAESLKEHEEIDEMLQQLDDMDPTSEEFMEMVASLQESVEEHVRHEEDDIFPIARQGMNEDESEQMARRHDDMAREFRQQAAR